MSCDDVLRELDFVFLLGFLGKDVLSFVDQGGSLFVDLGVNVFFNFGVGVRHLSDDEVKEDQGREDDHDNPSDPEQNVLLLVQLIFTLFFKYTEIEVSQRKS